MLMDCFPPHANEKGKLNYDVSEEEIIWLTTSFIKAAFCQLIEKIFGICATDISPYATKTTRFEG